MMRLPDFFDAAAQVQFAFYPLHMQAQASSTCPVEARTASDDLAMTSTQHVREDRCRTFAGRATIRTADSRRPRCEIWPSMEPEPFDETMVVVAEGGEHSPGIRSVIPTHPCERDNHARPSSSEVGLKEADQLPRGAAASGGRDDCDRIDLADRGRLLTDCRRKITHSLQAHAPDVRAGSTDGPDDSTAPIKCHKRAEIVWRSRRVWTENSGEKITGVSLRGRVERSQRKDSREANWPGRRLLRINCHAP